VLAVEHIGQLDQCDVHLRLDCPEDDVAEGLDATGTLIAAFRLGCRTTRYSELANPAYRSRHTNLEARRGGSTRHAAFNGRNQTRAKIRRQGFRHPCWPPHPAGMVNHNHVASGKPAESECSDYALGCAPDQSAGFRHTRMSSGTHTTYARKRDDLPNTTVIAACSTPSLACCPSMVHAGQGDCL
jgi:hypothetical protein